VIREDKETDPGDAKNIEEAGCSLPLATSIHKIWPQQIAVRVIRTPFNALNVSRATSNRAVCFCLALFKITFTKTVKEEDDYESLSGKYVVVVAYYKV
jgi:hypothetical protein